MQKKTESEMKSEAMEMEICVPTLILDNPTSENAYSAMRILQVAFVRLSISGVYGETVWGTR